jgi:hypothetical protein
MLGKTLCLPAVLALVAAAAPTEDPPRAEPDSHTLAGVGDSQRVICGPNCLYMFLAILNCPVAYSDVAGVLPLGRHGVDFLQMRDAARRFGVSCEIRHCRFDQLASCTFPVIGHIERRRSREEGDQDSRGHFVIVVDVTNTQVNAIDGTTGEAIAYTHDGFQRLWTGYLLVPLEGLQGVRLWINVAILLCGLALSYRLFSSSQFSRQRNAWGRL